MSAAGSPTPIGRIVGPQPRLLVPGVLSALLIKHVGTMTLLRAILSYVLYSSNRAHGLELMKNELETPGVIALFEEKIDWGYVSRKIRGELIDLRELLSHAGYEWLRGRHHSLPVVPAVDEFDQAALILGLPTEAIAAEVTYFATNQEYYMRPELVGEDSSQDDETVTSLHDIDTSVEGDVADQNGESSKSKGKSPLRTTKETRSAPTNHESSSTSVEDEPLPNFCSAGFLSQLLIRHFKTMVRLNATFACAPFKGDEGRKMLEKVVNSDPNKSLETESLDWEDMARTIGEETFRAELACGPLADQILPISRKRPFTLVNEIGQAAKDLNIEMYKVWDGLHTYIEQRAHYGVREAGPNVEDNDWALPDPKDISTPGVLASLLIRHIGVMQALHGAHTDLPEYIDKVVNSKGNIDLINEGIDWLDVAARVDYEVYGSSGVYRRSMTGLQRKEDTVLQKELAKVVHCSKYFDTAKDVLDELMYYALHYKEYAQPGMTSDLEDVD